MRGKEVEGLAPPAGTRITPAYAGKSVLGSSFITPCEDHPRLCGEKTLYDLTRVGALGSPPPMRGKGCFCFAVVYQRRITPAYAGKSARYTPHS